MKETRQIIEGKWNKIPKAGIRVICCDCGAKHTAEFRWFGKILKYRAFKKEKKYKGDAKNGIVRLHENKAEFNLK